MKLGKLARGASKVGMLIEGVTYLVAAGKALVGVVRGKRLDEASQDAVPRDEAPPGS